MKIYDTIKNYLAKLHIAEKIFLILNIFVLSVFLITIPLSRVERKGYIDFDRVSAYTKIGDVYRFYSELKPESVIFQRSDLFDIHVDTKRLPSSINSISGSTGISIVSKVDIYSDNFDKKNTYFYYTTTHKPDVYLYIIFLSSICLLYFAFRKAIIESIGINIIISMSIYILFLLLNNYVFQLFLKTFIIFDALFLIVFSFIIFYLSNKNKIITGLSILSFIMYFFVGQNILMTYQGRLFSLNELIIFWKSVFVISQLHFRIIMIIVTGLLISVILTCLFWILRSTIKDFNIKKIVAIVAIFSFVILFNNYSPFNVQLGNSVGVDYKRMSNRYGVILAKNLQAKIDKLSKSIVTEEEVLSAINLIKTYINKRDIEQLLLPTTKQSLAEYGHIEQRDVYIIILESFYDYSHFVSLFDSDPFNKEFRDWSNNSARIGPYTGSGSFYARLASLTGSSPFFPSSSAKYNHFLPNLFKEAGYKTIALEEAGSTYSLSSILPAMSFETIQFSIGNAQLHNYIHDNIVVIDEPKFVYGFTFLGHTGGWNSLTAEMTSRYNIDSNITTFMSKFEDKQVSGSVKETLLLSVITADEVIKIRDSILEKSPNALIILKHDHLAGSIIGGISVSTIDSSMKNAFLNNAAVSALLIWDGTNGAYKAPAGLVAENIPLFVALNTPINYKNTALELFYKDIIDNQISSYNNYYNIIAEDELRTAENVHDDLLELEKAVNTITKDIFIGKQHTYKLLANEAQN